MKVGIMSFAHMHAHSYANSLLKLKDVELVSIFDNDETRGKDAARKYNTVHVSDQEEFLSKDMDAVIICSENSRHKEMVIQAAQAKKNILCEKPIATTLKDGEEMIRACEENGVILQIAFPVRFNSSIRELKDMINRGELGKIIAFRTTNRGQNPGGWFIDKQVSGGGAVLDHTVHMIDVMRWCLGKEVIKVNAIVESYFHDINIDDAGLLSLEFENGVIASHDASWSKFSAYPTWGDVTIEAIGTKKTVKVDALQEHLRLYEEDSKPLKHLFYGNNMDFGLIKDFVDCVKEGREPSITGYDGLKALEVALAAYTSSDTKSTVRLK